jgi:hypothetical protein
MQGVEAHTVPPGALVTRPQPPPDLPSQLESLLDQVWLSEAIWRFEDRIDLAIRLETSLTGAGRTREPRPACGKTRTR